MKNLPVRKPTRLQNYDYSRNGCYFVTVCVKNRKKILSEIPLEVKRRTDYVGANCVRPLPTEIGKTVETEIHRLNTVYSNVFVDAYVLMPDHLHLLLRFDNFDCGRTQFAPTLSRVIKQFKGAVTKQVGFSMWQKGFYDHIVRTEDEYYNIWNYIEYNALKEYAEKAEKDCNQ